MLLLLTPLQWNIHALVAESSQAREDRKRRVSTLRCLLLPYMSLNCFSALSERAQEAGESSSSRRCSARSWYGTKHTIGAPCDAHRHDCPNTRWRHRTPSHINTTTYCTKTSSHPSAASTAARQNTSWHRNTTLHPNTWIWGWRSYAWRTRAACRCSASIASQSPLRRSSSRTSYAGSQAGKRTLHRDGVAGQRKYATFVPESGRCETWPQRCESGKRRCPSPPGEEAAIGTYQ